MVGACVPGYATAALPKSDKALSLALVAPDASVQVVVVERWFCACHLMWTFGTSEEDDPRLWWCVLLGRVNVHVCVVLWWFVWSAGVRVDCKSVWLYVG